MPKGYVVAQIEVTDQAAYEDYKNHAAQIVEDGGGTWLARGGQTAIGEGSAPSRIVVAEFDSFEAAVEAMNAVREIASERGQSASAYNTVAVEGV